MSVRPIPADPALMGDAAERAALRFFWTCVANGKLRYLDSEAASYLGPNPADFEHGGRNWHDLLGYQRALRRIRDLDAGFDLERCR